MDDRDLRCMLNDEAERHLPDRVAMLDRIERRRGTAPNRLMLRFRPVGPGPRRALNLMRPVAAGVAVSGLLVAGITGINLAGQSAPEVAASTPALSPTPEPPSSPSASPSSSPSASPSHKPPRKTARPAATHDGFLTANAGLNPYSIDNWGQSDLVLASTATITELDVTVRIAKTAGLVDAGHWTSVPANLVTSSVTSTASAYVYRFTLNAGATLSPGSYTFAAQYSHDAGTRSVAADAFDATATATRKAHVKGDFS